MSEADQLLALDYPKWRDKGSIVRGCRLTLLTTNTQAFPGEEIRVIHIVEAMNADTKLYMMAAKPVLGEHVDGILASASQAGADNPLRPPGLYDGPVVPGPAIDTGYEVSVYRFEESGAHRIVWRLGDLSSNELLITVS